MAQRTILHVGLPKTGSTFLQKNVFPGLELTYYSNKMSRRLRRLLLCNDTIHHKKLLELAREIRSHPRALVSNEGLIGEPQRSFQYHNGIAVRLAELFPGAEILLFVRRQDHYVESMYRQVIQQGWFHPLSEFLLTGIGREHRRWYPHVQLADLDWYAYYRSYQRIFGKSRVHVLAYEDLVADRAGFLAALSEIIGERLAVADQNDVDADRQNIGLSDQSIRIARLLNRLYRFDNRLGGLVRAQGAYRRARKTERGQAPRIERRLPGASRG